MYATGEDIIPGGFYVVQYDLGTPGSPDLGPEAFVSTTEHGDVDENGAVNFADIQLVVQAFQQNYANITLEAADIEPCVPNGTVNFADVLQDVLAFQGQTYNQTSCPLPCG